MAELKVVNGASVKEFDLTDDDVLYIQSLNSRLFSIKNLLKEFSESDSEIAFKKLV